MVKLFQWGVIVIVAGHGATLFPCVGCLGDGAGWDHVQQILPLALHGGAGLVGGEAGVHVRHRDTCRGTRCISKPIASTRSFLNDMHSRPDYTTPEKEHFEEMWHNRRPDKRASLCSVREIIQR